MAKKDSAPEEGEETKKKGKLVPMVVVFALVAGGAYFMFGKSCDEECQVEAEEAAATAEGPIVLMGAISINLDDGHFLKVVPALQLVEGADPVLYEDGLSAKAADLIVETLQGKKIEVLGSGEGRNKVKDSLRAELQDMYEGDVIDIYFTEFVMQ